MAMIVLWGPNLIQIYNDAYRALMADKHPSGLGVSTHACWPEARPFTASIYAAVLSGEAHSLTDQQLTLVRYGVPEPAFHLNYSPLRDGARIVGGLSRMDGYEVARRVRMMPGGQHVLLVAVTGWGQDEDKRRAREAGFDEHLTKPMDMETLRFVLHPEAANL